MAGRLSSPDFISRQSEIDRLAAAFAAASEGRPSLVLLAGEAGVGKSRLAAEVTRTASAAGGLVLEGGAIDLGDTPLPYGPIVEALRGLSRTVGEELLADVLDEPTRDALSHLLPEFAPASQPPPVSVLRPEWLRARTLEAVLSLLGRLGQRQPVVLVVEDVHWADRSTRDLLAFLVRNLHDERVLILATFRSDELHRRHPLLPWLAEMERQGTVERLDLAAFDRTEQAAQLASILGHPPSEDLLDMIHGRSDGNAFFAEELLGVTIGTSRVARENGRALPESLADLILTRVTTLPETAQRVLGVASVSGGLVEHEPLLEIADTDESDLEAALREAISRHFLIADHEPVVRYGFRHALAREAVYEDLLPSERRRLHERYAAVLSKRETPAGADGARHLAELAHHWNAAQVPKRALAASIEAADAARATFAYAEAATQYERAVQLWDVVQPSDRPASVDDVEICHANATVLGLLGEIRRAVEFASEAVRRLDPSVDEQRAAALRASLGRLQWRAGDLEAALGTYDEALTFLHEETASPQRAAVLAELASSYNLSGHLRRAVAVASVAIQMAIAVGKRATEGHAKNTKGAALSLLGDCGAGIPLLDEALAIAQELGDAADVGRAYANLTAALGACGRYERAMEMSIAGAEVARRQGMWRTLGVFFKTNIAMLLVEEGRWNEGSAILEEVEPQLTPGIVRLNHRVFAGRLAARRGDPDVHRYVDQTLDELNRMPDVQFTSAAFQTKIEAELYAGRPNAAAEAARDGIRRVSRGDDQQNSLMGLLALGTAAEAECAVIARAKADEGTVASSRARAAEYRQRLAALESRRSPDGGDAPRYTDWASAEYGRIDGPPQPEVWANVREAWTEGNRPFFAAYAGFREAEAALEAHRPRAEAARALLGAHDIAARLGARPLLGWIEGLARRARIDLGHEADRETAHQPSDSAHVRSAAEVALERFGLTRREREILALLATGWTNRRIADALFISESTAGVHVSNILGKLGAANRVEAATLAARLGVESPVDADLA